MLRMVLLQLDLNVTGDIGGYLDFHVKDEAEVKLDFGLKDEILSILI